jgi:hypothetical protein
VQDIRESEEEQLGHHRVLLTGLPNELLSDSMIDAMFQQAGLVEAVWSFKTILGSEFGQVWISLTSAPMAAWCCQHFHDRRWGNARVTAELLSPPAPTQPEPEAWEWLWDAQEDADQTWRVDAPEFVPQYQPLEPVSAAKSWLDEGAALLEKERRAQLDEKLAHSSNASTRDEGSESDEAYAVWM